MEAPFLNYLVASKQGIWPIFGPLLGRRVRWLEIAAGSVRSPGYGRGRCDGPKKGQ